MSNDQCMTRKEALHLLYTLSREGLPELLVQCAFEDYHHRFHQTWQAYLLLVEVVYGPPTADHYAFPCDLCRAEYAQTRVLAASLLSEVIQTPAGFSETPADWPIWCCSSCLKRWARPVPNVVQEVLGHRSIPSLVEDSPHVLPSKHEEAQS